MPATAIHLPAPGRIAGGKQGADVRRVFDSEHLPLMDRLVRLHLHDADNAGILEIERYDAAAGRASGLQPPSPRAVSMTSASTACCAATSRNDVNLAVKPAPFPCRCRKRAERAEPHHR
jgi:hypothetical protein